MRLQTKLGMAIATAILVPVMALAQAPPPPPEDGPDAGGPMIAEEMGGGGPDMEMDAPGGPGGPEMGMQHMGGGPGMGMHGMGMGRHRGHGGGLGFLVNNPEMRKQLGITDEQAAKIRQQTLDFQKTAIQRRADVQVKRLELRNLMTAENPDRAAIDRALQDLGSARLAAEKAAINHHLDMRAALTPEQRQKLQEMRHKFMGRGMGGRRGPGGPGGMMMHHRQGGQPQAKPQSEQ